MPETVAANYFAIGQRRHTRNSIIVIGYEVPYRTELGSVICLMHRPDLAKLND